MKFIILSVIFCLSFVFVKGQSLNTQYTQGKQRVADSIINYQTYQNHYIDKGTTGRLWWNLWDYTRNVYDSLLNSATGVSGSRLNDSMRVVYDSLAAIRADISGGGISAVYNFYGTIIHSGDSIEVDSLKFTSKQNRQKAVDSLNNLISLRVRYLDTQNIVAPYVRKADTGVYSTQFRVDTGVNKTRIWAISTFQTIGNYWVYSDTNNTLSTKDYRKKGDDSVSSLVLLRILKSDTGTYATQYRVDTAVNLTRIWALATFGTGTGTVTSVGSGYGLSGGAITTSGTLLVDSSLIATRLRVQKAIDSITSNYYSKTTSDGRFAPISINGTVTSVGSGFGLSGGSITTTGSLLVDTSLIATRLRVQKAIDSLNVIIATKGSGTVTSVQAGWGLNFTTITGSGSVTADSVALATRVRVQKAVDSLNVNIALKANIASPIFTGTVTIPTPFTLGATSVTITGTQLNYLASATGAVTFGAGGTNAYTDVAQSYTKGQAGTPVLLTDAATIAVDLSLSNNYRVQLGGNRTLGVPTNILAGQSGSINIWQDGTGSRTLAYSWPYSFSGATAPTLSTGKFIMDKLSYQVDYYTTGTVTMTIAAPCVITLTSHGLISGQKIQLTTTGALPTGVSASTTYYVNVTGANTFNISTTIANLQAGTYITSTGSQSGVHALVACGISGVLNADLR